MLYRKMEIFKDDTRIDILYRGMRIVQVGINADNQAIVAIPNSEEIVLDENLGMHLLPFDADVITRRITSEWNEPLPTFDRLAIEEVQETLTFQRAPRANQNLEVSGEHLLNVEVRNALNAILDSYVDEPVQSKRRTAEITNEIAERFDYPKYAVAGVRAALTKGIYGNFDELLAHRRVAKTRIARVVES